MARKKRRVSKSATPEHILMCNPVNYRIVSVDNPDMNHDVQPDAHIAQKQWTAIYNLYSKLGFRVSLVPPHPERQDMIFTANGAWGRKRSDTGESEYILSNFRNPSREREKDHFRSVLKTFDYQTYELPDGIPFEGQGDIVTTMNAYLFGNGIRSSFEAIKYVQRMLELENPIVPLTLVHPSFYHLDTCCMSLRGTETEGLVYVKEAFDAESLERVRALDIDNKYEIMDSPTFAQAMPCNSVFVDDVLLLNFPFPNYSRKAFEMSASGELLRDSEADPRYKEMLRTSPEYGSFVKFLWGLGYGVIPVYTSEFKKSGGGVRCLTLFLD